MDFLRLLRDKRVVLLDGAMGTQLDKRGLMGRGSANLEAPQAVVECIRAGAQIVGGCCGTSPDHIQAVHERIQRGVDWRAPRKSSTMGT